MSLLARLPNRTQLLVAWIVALTVIALLAPLHEYTDAEYAFMSAAIIPVFLVAWAGGFTHGFAVSILAVLAWTAAVVMSDRQFSAPWVPFLNAFMRLATYCFIAYLTARVKTLLQREIEVATLDPLTGLLNRRAFFERGEAEASRDRRYAHPLALLFLDLDNFKQLNDTRGHHVGDRALAAVGHALKNSLRETDAIARLGGDEFAILLPEISQDAAAETGIKITNTIKGVLADFQPVSASIGIAWFERGNGEFETMLGAADALMYEVKQEGKCGLRIRSFASGAS